MSAPAQIAGRPDEAATTRRVESLMEARKFQQADALLAPLIHNNHSDVEALMLLGRIRDGEGRAYESQEMFEQVLALSPGYVPAYLYLGQVQLEQGLNDDAETSFEAVLAKDGKNPHARYGEVKAAIASALQARRAGDQEGALVYLESARRWVPDDPSLLLDFGLQAEALHLYKDSETALKQALELRPADPTTIYAMSRIELDEQRMPEAESYLREYLKLRPEDASAHYGLGKILHMQTKDEAARKELQRSIELQPEQAESYYELGQIDLELHRDDEAASLFKKVLSRNPAHGGALTGLGILAFRVKDYNKAEIWFKSAVLYAADYAEAHRYYGMTLARLGKKEQSGQELATAASLDEAQTKARHGNVLENAEPPPIK